ncbi:hypothetical protein Q8W71_24770 [Methylobacterium sp. NEAU 140]|uniref:hypothetical protein n=1 Tax=Methylobacterium sp. NEAU 140 TaxID=3064945 RepID=UPI002734A110|nr:hypothetical protein [Methylobacterium sp. NEAU 140]MDP4025849.1 hypothetical protein [Methylobacterium sp. NEAU 140]
MQVFELIVIERASQRTLLRLPPAERPWGTFSRGELFRFEGRYFPIDQVISQFASRGTATLCSTILLVGSMLPESALGDVVIPEPSPLPEALPDSLSKTDAPVQDRGRRSWWSR